MALISFVTCDKCNPRHWTTRNFHGFFRGTRSQAYKAGWIHVAEPERPHGPPVDICPACQKKDEDDD